MRFLTPLILPFVLLLIGMAGINCAAPGEPDTGFLSHKSRDTISAATQAADDAAKAAAPFGIPLIGQIVAVIAALGGGILMIDKAVEIRNNGKNWKNGADKSNRSG